MVSYIGARDRSLAGASLAYFARHRTAVTCFSVRCSCAGAVIFPNMRPVIPDPGWSIVVTVMRPLGRGGRRIVRRRICPRFSESDVSRRRRVESSAAVVARGRASIQLRSSAGRAGARPPEAVGRGGRYGVEPARRAEDPRCAGGSGATGYRRSHHRTRGGGLLGSLATEVRSSRSSADGRPRGTRSGFADLNLWS